MGTYSLLPLFTTVLGGLMAITGVAVTHFFTGRRDRRKLLIEKLEEAYMVVDSLGNWVGDQQATILGYKPERVTTEDPISRVMLVLQVYLQNSEDVIELIKKSHSDVMGIIFQMYRNRIQEEHNEVKATISEFIDKRDILMKHREEALFRIRKKISSLL
jgi:hypothetical protein